MAKQKPDRVGLPERRIIEMRPSSYQPLKAEREEELDMPGESIETIRSAFFRSIVAKEPEE